MGFEQLKKTITKTLNVILSNPILANHFHEPCVLGEADEIVKTIGGSENIVVHLKLKKNQSQKENSYWVLHCADQGIVSVETLKKFRDSIIGLPGFKNKVTFITSKGSFTREAVNFAIENNIGLARLSPSVSRDKNYSLSDVVNGTNLMELKKALCDSEFGSRRKKFYGFTTKGKVDHLGSLENYIRKEILNS